VNATTLRTLAALLPVLALAAGCAATPTRPDAPATAAAEPTKLQETKITPTADACTGKGTYDANELLETGTAAFEGKDHARAAACFGLFATDFATDGRLPDVLFNLGLAEEELKRFADAETHFRRVLDEFPQYEDRADARLRLGHVLIELGKYDEAKKIYRTIAAPPDAPWFDKIEALTMIGVCDLRQGRFTLAEEHFWQAIHAYRRAQRLDEYVDTYALAQINFHRAAVKEALMLQTELAVPKDDSFEEKQRVIDTIEEKAKWLLDAQADYLQVIRLGHSYWATRSGYKIGKLYESLYEAIVNCPQPAGLAGEEVTVYLEELKKKVAVLLKKSLLAFRKVCAVADRIRVQNEWVKESRASLERLEKLLAEVEAAGAPPPAPPAETPEAKPAEKPTA